MLLCFESASNTRQHWWSCCRRLGRPRRAERDDDHGCHEVRSGLVSAGAFLTVPCILVVDMAQRIVLAEQFDRLRPKLHAVAYSMLGSVSEAEDAVQECWLRLDRSDPDAINDLQGWLTTVVGRICLDMLKARKARRERYLGSWLPEPVVEDVSHGGPEQQTVLADSIG